jgi:hypothetical protein
MEATVRWNLKVSRETDIALRTHLAQAGLRKGDLSKFVEDAVQKEVFARTVVAVKQRNAGVPAAQIEASIEDALAAVRLEKWGKPKARPRARSS